MHDTWWDMLINSLNLLLQVRKKSHYNYTALGRVSKLLPFKNDGGHCILGDLQCCIHVLVPFPRSAPRHNSVSELYRWFLRPHGLVFGGNMMVWGCFSGGVKVGDLYRVKGILKKEGFHSSFCNAMHSLWTALNWSQFPPKTGQWPKAQLQTMQ